MIVRLPDDGNWELFEIWKDFEDAGRIVIEEDGVPVAYVISAAEYERLHGKERTTPTPRSELIAQTKAILPCGVCGQAIGDEPSVQEVFDLSEGAEELITARYSHARCVNRERADAGA